MTNSHQSEGVAAYNESSLTALVRTIALSQGQFRLILARCNYGDLRDRLVQRLRELSPVEIRELILPKSVKFLYTTIQAELGDDLPKALMVFGLEAVNDLSSLLTSSNYIREEFSKNLPFPLIFWVNDEVLRKLLRLAPDLESWATSVAFEFTTDELLDFLRQKANQLFASNSTINLEDCSELEAAGKDLQKHGQVLEPDLEASLEFVRGLEDFANDQIDAALEHFQKSLPFWQHSNHLERQGLLILDIALCYYRKAELHRSESRCYWEQSRYYLRQCLNIFAQAKRPDLVAKYVSKLGEVLRHLKYWQQLMSLVQKAWKWHQKYGTTSQNAQNYGFLAEVALEESRWRDANLLAHQALMRILDKVPKYQFRERVFYRFLIARSYKHLGQVQESLRNLEQAIQESNPQDDPQLYIDILGELRSLYFQQGEYLKAFEIKQDKRSIEYQYGFQAFAGASHLQAKRQVTNPKLAQADQQAIIVQEITASGRKQFVKRLIERISGNHHKLTVIHGQSGVGKSSIIQAGLVPALGQQAIGDRDALPVVLRVYTDWVGMLGRCFTEAFEDVRGKSLPALVDSTEAIIEQLRLNTDRNLSTVLIFDQFEEFFFVCKEPTKRQQFYEFLGICLNIPFVKVILSLREDYLHYLLECNRLNHLDAINHNILDKDIICYLGNFSRDEAKVVIESLTNRSQFDLELALIDELVKDLAVEFDSVRPIELQVVGAQLQEDQITTLEKYRELGDNPKEALVKQYLEGVIKDCGKENERIARLVLYWLTDENLTRPLKTRSDLTTNLKVAGLKVEPEELDLVLPILVGSGLVVRVPESTDESYQLVHDYLVAFIRQQQGAEVEDLRKEVEFQKRRVEEFQVGQSDALSRYSEALFNQGKKLEALIEGLRAGIPLAQVDGVKTDTWIRVVTVLRQEVYGVLERNHCLEGHNDVVNSVSFSPDGKMIASGSGDGTIKLWNREGKLLHSLSGHNDVVNSVSFSSDGKMIASGSGDGTIKLWNREGELLHSLSGHGAAVNSISFSSDGKMIVSASWDGTIKLWNREGELLHSLSGHQGGVNSISFSPDCKMIASASWDKTIKLWNREGELLHSLSGHDVVVHSVSFSPDGKTIASGSGDKTIKLWNREGELLHSLCEHKAAVYSVSFSPDGKTIASGSGDGTIKLWNREGEILHSLSGHQGGVNSISFNPDGTIIASASWDKTIKLWNREGKLLHSLSGHDAAVYSISFSPDGKTIASSSWDKTIKLWNREGKLLHSLSGHDAAVYSVSFSPDGKMIASASKDKTIKLWNREGEILHSLCEHQGGVNGVSFSPDGKTIASGSGDGTIKLWNREGKSLHTLSGHDAAVNSISFNPDGKMIASASWDKTIKLWNREGELLYSLSGHDAAVHSVSFSPDGKTIASASRDKTIKLWNREGKLLHTLSEDNDEVNSISFSPDGKTIASASRDKIKLWNREGKLLHALSGHDAAVYSVSFSPDGRTIASGSGDGTVILWNLDLDDLLVRGCDLVRNYLKTNPNVEESDRHLCDGIGTQK